LRQHRLAELSLPPRTLSGDADAGRWHRDETRWQVPRPGLQAERQWHRPFSPPLPGIIRCQSRSFPLGGQPGAAEGVRNWIAEHYPAVLTSGYRDGYFSAQQEPDVICDIAQSGADLLLVALGVPQQELWIAQHLSATGVRVARGVGGLFDFYAGPIPRAPQWLREMGLEWLYRLYQESGRMWRRSLLGNVVFLYRVLMERLWQTRPSREAQVYR
jgi:exopolysaccharide biosynthesis WecB/TagA/CpsF family protein